jgi:hypothetical protein
LLRCETEGSKKAEEIIICETQIILLAFPWPFWWYEVGFERKINWPVFPKPVKLANRPILCAVKMQKETFYLEWFLTFLLDFLLSHQISFRQLFLKKELEKSFSKHFWQYIIVFFSALFCRHFKRKKSLFEAFNWSRVFQCLYETIFASKELIFNSIFIF